MSRVLLLLCVVLLHTALGLEIDIATSITTPLNVTRIASNLVKPESIKLFTNRLRETSEWAEVVLDYTYSVPLSLQLLQATPSSLVICMYEDVQPWKLAVAYPLEMLVNA